VLEQLDRAPSLVIFDCDGVLIDSEVIFCAVDADALTGLGHPTGPRDIARRFAGIPHRVAWDTISAEIGFAQPDRWIDDILAECERRMEQELQPIEGAAQLLADLSQVGIASCVASSTGLAGLRRNLERCNLLALLDPNVFSVTQVRRPKPAPDVFLHTAAQMGADPSACLVVEDSVAGVTAARRAGMRTLGFLGGGHVYDGLGSRLLAAGAAGLADDMAEVATALGIGPGAAL
jgi:HAD superfamily hydrolase (TIGR01509 family)